jgi:hypothetical protein
MPAIDAYYRAHRAQGLEVLALSTDALKDESKVREAAQPFSFPVAMLKNTKLTGFGRIWRMPVSAVTDREGRLVKLDCSSTRSSTLPRSTRSSSPCSDLRRPRRGAHQYA